MARFSTLRQATATSWLALLMVTELGKAAMIHAARRDASKRIFQRTLADQHLPAEVVDELSAAYEAGQIRLRDLVRDRGFR